MEFSLKTSTGRYDINAHCRFVGRDLLVAVWGGERPHIGAVSVAHPRSSLQDPEKTSATASVICLSGHKEDDLARQMSLQLASGLNTHVVVTAGIHWDDLPPEGIQQVVKNCDTLTHMILQRIL